MLHCKRRVAALSLGVLMTLNSFWGCSVTPTQNEGTDPAVVTPQTTVPFEKEDPMLHVTRPVEGNTDNVAQVRLYNMRSGWMNAFETENGMYFLADSVQSLHDGLSRLGIQVAEMDLSAYDDGFFAQNRLVVIPRSTNSGSVRFGARIDQTADGVKITPVGTMPEVGTSDMADWLVLVPLDNTQYTGSVTVENVRNVVSNNQRYALHRF